MTIELSTIKSDFPDYRVQLQSLLQSYDSWKDRLTSGTGQMLLDMIAGVASNNVLSIERAVQEAFLETALSRSGVYSAARLLGTKVLRSRAAKVGATFTKPTAGQAYTLPAYTAFQIGADSYFSPEAVVVGPGASTATLLLRQGEQVEYDFTSNGARYQTFTFGDPDFSASNDYVRVLINGVEWAALAPDVGMWSQLPNARVYREATTQDGKVEIQFGNGLTGAIPPLNAAIVAYVYRTRGAAANAVGVGLEVKCLADAAFKGLTTTDIVDGQGAQDLDDVRFLTPNLFASGFRAVTRKDFKSIALRYPGIVDVSPIGETELGPGDPTFQNVVGLVVITTRIWSPADQSDFLAYLQAYAMSQVKLLYIAANEVPIDTNLSLIIDRNYASATVTQAVLNAIQQFLAPKIGSLGKPFYLANFTAAIMDVPGVVHATISAPSTNYDVSYDQYVYSRNVTFTSVTYNNALT